jgi:hypothetical protein
MASRQIAVIDGLVVEVDKEQWSGTVRIFEPLRSELKFGYAIFCDDDVVTMSKLTVGRQVRAELWTPTRTPGKHHLRNI